MVRIIVQIQQKNGNLVKQTIETVDVKNDELESLLMNNEQNVNWDVRVTGAQILPEKKKLNCGKPFCPHSALEEEDVRHYQDEDEEKGNKVDF